MKIWNVLPGVRTKIHGVFRHEILRNIIQMASRNPLWIGIMLCAFCGVLLGSTLSRTVPQQVTLSNSIANAPSTAEPSGLHHSAGSDGTLSDRAPRLSSSATRNRRSAKTELAKTELAKTGLAKTGLAKTNGKNAEKWMQQKDGSGTTCAANPRTPRNPQELKVVQKFPLTRFRSMTNPVASLFPEKIQVAHITNFGWRFLVDWFGKPAVNQPIVVLHETVGSDESVFNLFQTEHEDEDEQVSYHVVIREDGAIVYVVPPEYRAYGAGNSVFVNADRQEEFVQTHPTYPPSVNNFAYHISLVTPEDGRNDEEAHSGYTRNQYESLAWLAAKTGVADDRITLHRLIDRSGSRMDPRSFNAPYFLERLHSYPRSSDIQISCTAD